MVVRRLVLVATGVVLVLGFALWRETGVAHACDPVTGQGCTTTSSSTTPNSSTTTSSTTATSSSTPNNNHSGSTSGSSGNQGGTSGQTNESTTTTASPPPPVVATLTSTGDGVLVHRYNGTTVNGYPGQPLRLHEVVEVIGPPGQPTGANPATIDWLAGGTSDIYDAKPQQFVPGQGFVGRVHTQVDVNFGPGGGAASVLSGFMRFFFPAGDTKRYKFEASTGTVTTSVKGTDFTVGFDPDTNTSAVFVTQDSVDVTPTNTSLQPFTLSAGNQVEVTPDVVGPVTPLGGAAASPTTPPAKSSSGTSVSLIVGIIVGVLVLGALLVLLLLYLRRRAHVSERDPVGATPEAAVGTPAAGTPAASQALPAQHGAQDDLALTQPATPIDESSTATQPTAPLTPWSPTHRAPEGGMACWAAPDLSSPIVGTLHPGSDVQVLDRQDQWAHIACSNGWTTWVDARLLVTEGTDGVEP
jgi:hypothetical protein